MEEARTQRILRGVDGAGTRIKKSGKMEEREGSEEGGTPTLQPPVNIARSELGK